MDPRPLIAAIERALDGGPPIAPAPPPWLGWLVVALCRQRVRQRWLVEVARTRLGGPDGDGEQTGDVPGLAGWTFYFHGSGLCLERAGPDGHEVVDVDFDETDGATIDPYFFARRALTLEPAPPPEARVGRWLVEQGLVVTALDELRRAGVIEHPTSDHVFRLAGPLEARVDELAAVDLDDPATLARWAAHLGDAELTGGDPDAVRAAHRTWALALLDDRRVASRVIQAVAEAIGPDAALIACERLIEGPIDPATGKAIEVLRGVAPLAPSVERLLARLDPAGHHPYPAWAATAYLLERGEARGRALEVLHAFAAVEQVAGHRGNPYEDHLAALVLEHDPARALPLVRRALRSSTPAAVTGTAALLAVLDQPWCHRELEAALLDRRARGDDRVTSQRYLAAALRVSTSDVARRRGATLGPPPPARDPDAIGYTFDEVSAANLDDWFAGALDEARPLAARLRGHLPDDLGAADP